MDADLREFSDVGGTMLSYDQKRAALISVLPPEMRKDILFHINANEPRPGAGADEQEMVFMQLRLSL